MHGMARILVRVAQRKAESARISANEEDGAVATCPSSDTGRNELPDANPV